MARPSPVSDAGYLRIESLDGSEYLELRSRALPYLPLVIGGKQRAEFTWFPGSPSAVVQMLGPEEEPITMNGFWKDRFLYANDVGQINPATYSGLRIFSAMELSDYVDRMRTGGAVYKLSWDRLVRYGHITNFRHSYHNIHDVEWELEFTVSSLGLETTSMVVPNSANVLTLSQQIAAFGEGLLDTLDTYQQSVDEFIAPFVEVTDAFSAVATTFDRVVTAYSSAVVNVSNQVVGGALGGFDAARSMFSTVGQAVDNIANTASQITDRAVAEYFAFAGGQNDSPVGQQIASYSYVNDIGQKTSALLGVSVFGRQAIQQQMQNELLATHIAAANEDLRDVATRYYKTPDRWIDLMTYNGYTNSRLDAGDVVWVPPESINGGLGSGGDY